MVGGPGVTVQEVRPVSAIPSFVRSPHNPILTAATWPYPVDVVCNPGAALDGEETVLLCRVEDRRGLSHLTVARSVDGVHGWQIEPQPLLAEQPTDPHSHLGVEDPRVTWVGELGGWVITYTVRGKEGPGVGLALTTDFTKAESLGMAMLPDDKSGCLLPRRCNGEFVLFHRPNAPNTHAANVWLSRSDDLRSWSAPRRVLVARQWPWWDSARVGMGPPPIETPEGWLGVYYGVKDHRAGFTYRAGLVLLDLDDPGRVLRRSEEWVLAPAQPYEVSGAFGNVVFPSGLIRRPGSDELRLYYGAAGARVALATASLSEMLDYLLGLPEAEPPD
jgi:beta-1,2-mannobiose phosphorylase / 1,2-beta-oligomannan phosphorylase